MTTEKMVTRCPQCATSFRITPAQLQSARGAVRCGACLHIFKARDHLVGAKAPKPDPALVRKPTRPPASQPSPRPPAATRPTADAKPGAKPPAQPPLQKKPATAAPQVRKAVTSGRQTPPPKPSPAPPARKASPEERERQKLKFDQSLIDSESGDLDDDDFLISDDMGRKTEDQDPFGVASSTPSSHSLFERKIRSEREKDQESEAGDDADESWAMSLLEDEEETAQSSATLSRATADENTEHRRSRDERMPSFELIDEPGDAHLETPTGEDHLQFELEEPDTGKASSYEGERLRAHSPHHNSERSALLMGIDPEPVEMTWTQQRRRRKWLWGSLALAALLVLVVQVAWLQFDRFSRIEPYRSAYEVACSVLGCELPALVDRSRIRAYNLVVRNHPEREGALVVDAILLNNARFAQPFPELVLEFSDLNGTAIAAREFSPSEYLSGELAGRDTMPPNQPIHLTLELVDPGDDAVNYRAYIPD